MIILENASQGNANKAGRWLQISSLRPGKLVHLPFNFLKCLKLCHPDRSAPGFPAAQHHQWPRVRLSVKKAA
jgi:hypothetical protein